jgi:hypothetical protein
LGVHSMNQRVLYDSPLALNLSCISLMNFIRTISGTYLLSL